MAICIVVLSVISHEYHSNYAMSTYGGYSYYIHLVMRDPNITRISPIRSSAGIASYAWQ